MEEPRVIYHFDDRSFRPGTGEIVGPDGPHRLAPQPARLLTLLLEHAGELVSRDVLKERIWPDTVIEFDKGLNFCVREVRAALGDQASDPVFIETLPRRGYRFLPEVQVERLVDQVETTGDADARKRHGRTGEPGLPERPGLRSWALIAASIVAVALLGIGVWTGQGSADLDETSMEDARAREAAEMGGYLLRRDEGDDLERSLDFFREALRLDPAYARAHAGLGAAYLRLSRIDEGKEALHRSLELDPEQWLPHVQLGQRALYVEYDAAVGLEHVQAARLNAPGEVVTQHVAAWAEAVTGDLERATRTMQTALDLDPVSPRVRGDVGRLYYLAGRPDEAVAQCARTLELVPEVLRPRDCMVHAFVEMGALDEAREAAAQAMATQSVSLDEYWRWAGETIEELARTRDDSFVHAAAAWARAGLPDRAFLALERAYQIRCPILAQAPLDPAFAELSDDPRWSDLLRRIDLRRTQLSPMTATGEGDVSSAG